MRLFERCVKTAFNYDDATIYLLSIQDVQTVEVLQGEQDVGSIELGGVLLESANLTQIEEELTTRAVLETEEKLLLRLEGEVHLDNEAMTHTFLLINVG